MMCMYITKSSAYYLKTEDFVLASTHCTRHVTVFEPSLSKLHRKVCSLSSKNTPKTSTLGDSLVGYGAVGGDSPSPVDILNIKAPAPLFASAPVLSFHGHAVRPPPCKALLQWEHA